MAMTSNNSATFGFGGTSPALQIKESLEIDASNLQKQTGVGTVMLFLPQVWVVVALRAAGEGMSPPITSREKKGLGEDKTRVTMVV